MILPSSALESTDLLRVHKVATRSILMSGGFAAAQCGKTRLSRGLLWPPMAAPGPVAATGGMGEQMVHRDLLAVIKEFREVFADVVGK